MKLNQWHPVAGVFQKGRSIRLYVDGVEAGSSAAFTGESKACASAFYIGRRGGGQFFAGAVDDVRLYARALAADEVRALADGGNR